MARVLCQLILSIVRVLVFGHVGMVLTEAGHEYYTPKFPHCDLLYVGINDQNTSVSQCHA